MNSKSGILLLVDDDEMNRDMLARRLKRKQYEVKVAAGGRQALELLEQQPFDAVLLDIEMPEMSGLEVLKTLRRTYPPSQLPIIMITARSRSEDITEALELGANDYVTKPIDFAVALARIRTQLALKDAEDALRETHERTRLIIDTALDAVVTMDTRGQITGWNREAEAIIGWPREEAIGRILSDTIIATTSREALLRGLQGFQATGQSAMLNRRTEITALRRDGCEFPAELAVSAARIRGEWTFSVFIRDITERKAAEEVLRRSHDELERRVLERTKELALAKNEAEAANRAKSEFLANVSHELRTPLNGILGMTELTLDTDLTAEQRDYLETSRSSALSLVKVINDILDFSKIEARKLDLDVSDFSVRGCLHDVLKTVTPQVLEKGLETSYDVNPDVPAMVAGDPGRLRQILLNLMGNAIKFTEWGKVTVTVVKETQSAAEIVLHFRVSDTGIGIPLQKQRVIFEAFTQADGSSTRKYSGTGLGLTISRQLVDLMNGRIWVESEPGHGSIFHFTVCFGCPMGQLGRPIQSAPYPATSRR